MVFNNCRSYPGCRHYPVSLAGWAGTEFAFSGGFELESKSKIRISGLAAATVLSVGLGLLLPSLGCSGKQDGADVMASVNGRKITRTEVQKYYDTTTAESPQKPSLEQADTLRLNILRELMETGKVKPVIDRRYSLSEVPEAIRYLEKGHAQGKVVIT